jgi:CRISPR-associated protein Cas2
MMTLTDSPPSLRGELTRWMIEIRPHVYVGNVNARVRDQLWLKACAKLVGGSVLQIWNSPTEQGYVIRSFGARDYQIRDFEGVLLVERPPVATNGNAVLPAGEGPTDCMPDMAGEA